MNISPFLTMNHSCGEALRRSRERLTEVGLHSVQTFDLYTARSASQAPTCPNHGTEECDCQMVVLLVYGKAEEPITLILHGNEGRTWLSISESHHHQLGANLSIEVKQALEKISSTMLQDE